MLFSLGLHNQKPKPVILIIKDKNTYSKDKNNTPLNHPYISTMTSNMAKRSRRRTHPRLFKIITKNENGLNNPRPRAVAPSLLTLRLQVPGEDWVSVSISDAAREELKELRDRFFELVKQPSVDCDSSPANPPSSGNISDRSMEVAAPWKDTEGREEVAVSGSIELPTDEESGRLLSSLELESRSSAGPDHACLPGHKASLGDIERQLQGVGEDLEEHIQEIERIKKGFATDAGWLQTQMDGLEQAFNQALDKNTTVTQYRNSSQNQNDGARRGPRESLAAEEALDFVFLVVMIFSIIASILLPLALTMFRHDPCFIHGLVMCLGLLAILAITIICLWRRRRA